MKFDNWVSQSFGLVFFAIVMSGVFLTFSLKLAFITLVVAFSMNTLLFGVCVYKAIKGEVEAEFEIHP